jgi:hypothetical protein
MPPRPTMSVREYQALLRDVQDLAPNYKDRLMPGNFEDGVMVSLNHELRSNLDLAVKGTRAEQQLADAKRYYQEVKVPFRDNVANVLAPAEQSQRYVEVMDLMVRADDPTRLKALMKELPDDLRQGFKQSWLNHHVVEQSYDPTTGLFDPKKALTELEKLSSETRNALFEGQARDVETILTRLAQEVKYREGLVGKAAVAGKVGIPLSVGFFMLAQGNFAGAVPAIAAGAAGVHFLGHVLASRRMARYFARGLETPAGSRIARRYGQLILHGTAGEAMQLVNRPETPMDQIRGGLPASVSQPSAP